MFFSELLLQGRTQRQRIYYIEKEKNYASLTQILSSNLIRMDWIVEQWDKMGQFYASLEKGHAKETRVENHGKYLQFI